MHELTSLGILDARIVEDYFLEKYNKQSAHL